MNKFRKIICGLLCLAMGVVMVSCKTEGKDSSSGNEEKPEKIKFTQIWSDGVTKQFADGETYTLNIGGNVGAKNYLKIDYSSDCYLDATMFFTETNGSKTYSERFFLTNLDNEFRQILDYYHANKYDKTLDRIEFRCVGGKGGTLTLSGISAAKHPIDFSGVNFYSGDLEPNMELFIHGNNVKLGAALKYGGAISYISSINEGVKLTEEYGQVYVGHSNSGNVLVEDDINLINAHDTGRLVQQSFYGTKGDSIDNPKDDYVCGYFNHDGDPSTADIAWPYNPVQGGDKYVNCSQLIDVQYDESYIYVKTRPLDWAKNFSITPFYMENTYRIEDDPVYGEYVHVTNRSTDFSGYVHDNIRDQELPAFYGITPLGRLTTYRGISPWTDDSTISYDNLGFWSPGTGNNRFRATENWIAWLNADNWGVGLYVPDVESMLVGRTAYSTNIDYVSADPSHYAGCNYTAPLGRFSMPTYDSFGYDYFIKADYVGNIRNLFKSLHLSGASNENLLKLEGRK